MCPTFWLYLQIIPSKTTYQDSYGHKTFILRWNQEAHNDIWLSIVSVSPFSFINGEDTPVDKYRL